MRTNDGLNTLMVASLRDHPEVVRLLLENNAVIDSQTDQGASALMIAAANGHTKVVKLLLAYGANTALKNKNGKAAIDIAANDRNKIASSKYLNRELIFHALARYRIIIKKTMDTKIQKRQPGKCASADERNKRLPGKIQGEVRDRIEYLRAASFKVYQR